MGDEIDEIDEVDKVVHLVGKANTFDEKEDTSTDNLSYHMCKIT